MHTMREKSSLRAFAGRIFSARTARRAIVQTFFANVGVQGINLACGIITARALGPGGRGILAAVVMWPQFLAYAMTLGVPTASVYWLRRKPEMSRELAGSSLVIGVFSGVIAVVVGVCIIPASLHTYPRPIIHLAQMWALVTPLSLIAVTLISLLQAAGAFSHLNVFRVLSPLSVLIVLVVEKRLGRLTYSSAALAYLLATVPVTVWVVQCCFRHFRPKLTETRTAYKLLLSYGLRAWGADLLGSVATQVDRVLLVGLLAPESMGLYVVAQSVAGVLGVLPRAVLPVALQRTSGLSDDRVMDVTGRALRITLYIMVLASIPLFLFGGMLVRFIYGPRFLHLMVVLPFLLVEAVADGLTAVLGQAFLASGLPGMVTLLQCFGLSLSVPLLYVLIPRYGLSGAGFAVMMSTLLRFVLVLSIFPLRLKKRPPSFIMRRTEWMALLGDRAGHKGPGSAGGL